jgi:uncharacterized protein (UPF0262 family)
MEKIRDERLEFVIKKRKEKENKTKQNSLTPFVVVCLLFVFVCLSSYY